MLTCRPIPQCRQPSGRTWLMSDSETHTEGHQSTPHTQWYSTATFGKCRNPRFLRLNCVDSLFVLFTFFNPSSSPTSKLKSPQQRKCPTPTTVCQRPSFYLHPSRQLRFRLCGMLARRTVEAHLRYVFAGSSSSKVASISTTTYISMSGRPRPPSVSCRDRDLSLVFCACLRLASDSPFAPFNVSLHSTISAIRLHTHLSGCSSRSSCAVPRFQLTDHD